MLTENVIDWSRKWKDAGRQEGRQEACNAGDFMPVAPDATRDFLGP